MPTAADKARAYRLRKRSGAIVPRPVVDEVGLIELLVGSGFLQQCKAEDRRAIDLALGTMLESMILADVEVRHR